LRARETLSLGASQVDQLKLAGDHILRVLGVRLFQVYRKDAMRARGRKIHLVGSYRFILDPLVEEGHDVGISLAFKSKKVFHRVQLLVVPFQLQAIRVEGGGGLRLWLRVCGGWGLPPTEKGTIKEVVNTLIIDFKE